MLREQRTPPRLEAAPREEAQMHPFARGRNGYLSIAARLGAVIRRLK